MGTKWTETKRQPTAMDDIDMFLDDGLIDLDLLYDGRV